MINRQKLDRNRLVGLLENYNVSTINRLIDLLRFQRDNSLRKNTLVTRLASFYGSKEHEALLAKRLTPRHWLALSYPKLQKEPVSFGSLRIRLRALKLQEGEISTILFDLLSIGALFFLEPLPSKEKIDITPATLGESLYDELRLNALPEVLESARAFVDTIPPTHWLSPPPSFPKTASPLDLQREAYLGLRAAIDGQIRITNRGVPFKADVSRLSVSGSASAPRNRGRTPSESLALARYWFVLALLLGSNLVELGDGKLVPGVDASLFLEMSLGDQIKRLYLGWIESPYHELYRVEELDLAVNYDRIVAWSEIRDEQPYGYDVPSIYRLVSARKTITETLKTAASESASAGWLSFDALSLSIQADEPDLLVSHPHTSNPYSHNGSYYGQSATRRPRYYEGIHRSQKRFPENQLRRGQDWGEVEGAYIAESLAEPLFWLGMVDLGYGVDGKLTAFRLSELGRYVLFGEPFADQQIDNQRPTIVVQPNFEVIVLDATANLGLVSTLDDFAERVRLDRAATFKLTRDSIVRGLARGQAIDAIIETLVRASGAGLPQNVVFSIEEWARLYERIHVHRRATVLIVDSPEIIDEWLSDKAFARFFSRRVGPTVILVPSDRRSMVEGMLAKDRKRLRAFDYSKPISRVLTVQEPAEIELSRKADEPYVRYRLRQIAEPIDENSGLRYRLSAQSVKSAIKDGLTPQKIELFLHRASGDRLPSDTLLRLRGWSGLYGTVGYQNAIVAKLPIGLTWSELERIPEIQRAVTERLSAYVALINREELDSVRAALGERGIALEAFDDLSQVESLESNLNASNRLTDLRAGGSNSRADSRRKRSRGLGDPDDLVVLDNEFLQRLLREGLLPQDDLMIADEATEVVRPARATRQSEIANVTLFVPNEFFDPPLTKGEEKSIVNEINQRINSLEDSPERILRGVLRKFLLGRGLDEYQAEDLLERNWSKVQINPTDTP